MNGPTPAEKAAAVIMDRYVGKALRKVSPETYWKVRDHISQIVQHAINETSYEREQARQR